MKNSNVKIGYFTVNRNGFFDTTGLPKLSANLFLEYSNNGNIYFRKCITIDDLLEENCNLAFLYQAMKEQDEFAKAKDSIPVYVAPVVVEEVIEQPIENVVEIPVEEIVIPEPVLQTEAPIEVPTV